ncbi:MAG: hypothetical protein IJS60_05445 [Abditibacteriota bacterium]|nr:hypothetical protein [Abditibacteriota bacterium]
MSKFIFVFIIFCLCFGYSFSFEKLDISKDECYLIEYDTKETIYKMPDKWFNIWKKHAEEELSKGIKEKNSWKIRTNKEFIEKLNNKHTGINYKNKKSLFIGNNDFGLWCESFKGLKNDRTYFNNGKDVLFSSLDNLIDFNLQEVDGYGNSISILTNKQWYFHFPFLGFDSNYNSIIDNKILYDNIRLDVENSVITLMDGENVYIKYSFGSNELIPKKVIIDYYCDYDYSYHQRTLELTLSKIEKHKVADLLKDIYHPDEVTSVTKDNKVVTYYPGEESTIEVLNKDNEIPKKAIILSYILKIVLLVLIIFILVRLFSKVAKKKEGK